MIKVDYLVGDTLEMKYFNRYTNKDNIILFIEKIGIENVFAILDYDMEANRIERATLKMDEQGNIVELDWKEVWTLQKGR